MFENGHAIPSGELKEAHTVLVPDPQESREEGGTAECRLFERILGESSRSQKTGEIGEGGPVPTRDHGATGDQTLPEVIGVADQEVTLPEVGEGDRTGFQDGSSFSGSSHTMSPRGGRGILG